MFILSRRRSRSGAFLMEALLAMVILAVSLVLLIQSIASSLRACAYSSDHAEAVLWAENVFFEPLRQRALAEELPREGVFSGAAQEYRYRISSRELTADDDPDALRAVNGEISWGGEGRERTLSLTTFLKDLSDDKKDE